MRHETWDIIPCKQRIVVSYWVILYWVWSFLAQTAQLLFDLLCAFRFPVDCRVLVSPVPMPLVLTNGMKRLGIFLLFSSCVQFPRNSDKAVTCSTDWRGGVFLCSISSVGNSFRNRPSLWWRRTLCWWNSRKYKTEKWRNCSGFTDRKVGVEIHRLFQCK